MAAVRGGAAPRPVALLAMAFSHDIRLAAGAGPFAPLGNPRLDLLPLPHAVPPLPSPASLLRLPYPRRRPIPTRGKRILSRCDRPEPLLASTSRAEDRIRR